MSGWLLMLYAGSPAFTFAAGSWNCAGGGTGSETSKLNEVCIPG